MIPCLKPPRTPEQIAEQRAVQRESGLARRRSARKRDLLALGISAEAGGVKLVRVQVGAVYRIGNRTTTGATGAYEFYLRTNREPSNAGCT